MKLGIRLISGMLVLVLTVGMVLSVQAKSINDMKNQQQQLEEQKKEAESEKKSLAARVQELASSMKQTENRLEQKRAEIDQAEQDLIMAKMEESEQYESMKLRIRYMYENGNVNLIEIFMESDSIADFFNKTEYIKKMSEYDRQKLDEFQRTVRAVEEKELVLQAEYGELETLQASLAQQSAEAKELLNAKSSELANIQSQLKGIKDNIKKAEEEARRAKEREEANKKPASNSGNSNSGNTGKPGNSSGSSTVKPKPPVVSGNGYFTHPCPGMSYQSSYFGEVRQGIGDPNPHKGHDYAAPRGTPIYAAAAGTVLIAGYSSSAGYWVVISHGNGLVTKYMHMYESPYVSAGDKVAKGQHIGGVGTTGQSTGNHLHFQVEVDGVAVNPSKYM